MRLELVWADEAGRIFSDPDTRPAGMKAGQFFPLEDAHLVPLPAETELFRLPERVPVGFRPGGGDAFPLTETPRGKGRAYAVAAFLPPGYTLTHNAAFHALPGAKQLPLFAYGACVRAGKKFYAAAVRVDRGARHDVRQMDTAEVKKGIGEYKRLYPENRLVGHLAGCATVNGCANAKNFFLGRFEAPIPTASVCNAQCQGCISLQPDTRDFPSTQERIKFAPTAEEIAELVLRHFEREKDPIVSFGQGCEGEPTLMAGVIESAIRLIRKKTPKGLINVNTNASRPQAVAKLFEAGLTNIRVSLNSVREPYYSRYYQPKGYSFAEVAETVRVAKKAGGFVSLNYLSMPGFTDSRNEFEAFRAFLAEGNVGMVQWRNLNYDPLRYFEELRVRPEAAEMLGMGEIVERVGREFPKLLSGYFNPRKRLIRR